MQGGGGGGGGGGRTIGDVVGERLLTMLEQKEEELDQQLHQMENLEEDEVERMRAQRLEVLKRNQKQKQEWLAQGHGEYREVEDQKRFFEELKGSNRAVVHFYRPTTRRCEIVDKHLFPLARKHVETKFVRVNAEKAPYLTEKLHIWMLPTLVCVKDGKTDHSIVGFDEMGGRDDFDASTLEAVLLKHGAVLESFCG